MRYGFIYEGGDLNESAEVAAEAEAAGWDGVFIADAMAIGMSNHPPFPWFDPWITLAVMAMRTEQIKIGTFITPISRRRPWKLVRETVTIDHLSKGRLIFGVGLGAAKDDGGFFKVGEQLDLKVRAQMLDEGLAIIDGLWSGKPFSFSGQHFKVEDLVMLPTPVQTPRIPVWVVGVWPRMKSMRRAVRWDGIIPQIYQASMAYKITPDDVRAVKGFVDENRPDKGPFDIVVGGTSGKSRKKDVEYIRPLAEAGATWWLESVWSSAKKMHARIKQGPPRFQ
ncbi:MAG TPA: LLM class flavin-dependent oxidoreductase [Blastocatellia bacterium]|nr:LLM class flavin-dependent oxidoreductase [Blastocatellia bacterium]